MKNAIMYARFSPRPNAETSESVEHQIKDIEAWCDNHGYTPVLAFADKSASGGEYERRGIWDAIHALKRDYALVVRSLDRLARDVYLQEVLFREVKKRGAELISINGEGTGGDSPDDVMLRQVLAAISERQRKVCAAQTKAALLRMQSEGKTISSNPPYGMMEDPDSPIGVGGHHTRMIVDEDEMATCRKVVELRKTGLSMDKICRRLEDMGLKHRGQGKRWHRNQVKRIVDRYAT